MFDMQRVLIYMCSNTYMVKEKWRGTMRLPPMQEGRDLARATHMEAIMQGEASFILSMCFWAMFSFSLCLLDVEMSHDIVLIVESPILQG